MTGEGVEYEADQRHAELMVREMGVQLNSKGVVTPGTQDPAEDGKEHEVDQRVLRGVAARGNYLGQDRVDMQYAAKEISRFVSKPESKDWRAAKRLARYLKDESRLVIKYPYQELSDTIDVWIDTDFAGCKVTRRSTSGGVIMIGDHCVKTYSKTQESIALSSGESEFYGIVQAACHGLEVKGVYEDLGIPMKIRICTDSSAAKSIASRRGVGKVRHIDVRELWVQERTQRGDIEIVKVRGEDNLADILTKHVPRYLLDKHLRGIGCERRSGRHILCPATVDQEKY